MDCSQRARRRAGERRGDRAERAAKWIGDDEYLEVWAAVQHGYQGGLHEECIAGSIVAGRVVSRQMDATSPPSDTRLGILCSFG